MSKTKVEVSEFKPMERTAMGLREVLFDEIDALRKGTSNPNKMIALSKVACQVINSVKMEIEYQKHVASLPQGNNDASLRLVSSKAS